MKKKIAICFLLVLAVIINLCACGTSATQDEQQSANAATTENTPASSEDTTAESVTADTTAAATTTEPVTEEVSLSSSCDRILASGADSSGDYYEMVANQSETYAGVEIQIGIIKNNKWLLEMTSDMPFIYNKMLYGGKTLDNTFGMYYIGNGCFAYYPRIEHYTQEVVIYNAETGQFRKRSDDDGYNYNNKSAKSVIEYSVSRYNNQGYNNQIKKVVVSDEENVIWRVNNPGPVLTFLNTTTMELSTVTLSLPEGKSVNHIYPLSEGLIGATCFNGASNPLYFFNTSGEIVLDLSSYKLTHKEQELVFKDGQCTFTIINNNKNYYEITIDKEGNVISSTAL